MLIVAERRRFFANVPDIPLCAAVVVLAHALLAKGAVGGAEWITDALLWVFLASQVKVYRRVDAMIAIRRLFGTRYVDGKRAALGVTLRTTSRFAHYDLQLLPGGDFGSARGGSDIISIETFNHSNGLGYPMGVAERAARCLGVGEPMLAPGIIDDRVRPDDSPPSSAARAAAKAARNQRWRMRLGVAAAVLGAPIVFTHFMTRTATFLAVRAARPLDVRTPIGEFLLTGTTEFSVDPGDATLSAWDRSRECWASRRVVFAERSHTSVDMDDIARTEPCSSRDNPPTPPKIQKWKRP